MQYSAIIIYNVISVDTEHRVINTEVQQALKAYSQVWDNFWQLKGL